MSELPKPQEIEIMLTRDVPLEILEQTLRPNGASKAGFIGEDERLVDNVREDFAIVEKYGTSHVVLAKKIRDLIPTYDLKNNSLVFPQISLHPDYEYIPPSISTLGNQECPWGCHASGNNEGLLIKKNATDDERNYAEFCESGISISQLTNVPLFIPEREIAIQKREEYAQGLTNIRESLQNGQKKPYFVVLTGLLPHLVEEHYFFEGKESPFRADPGFLISAFQLG